MNKEKTNNWIIFGVVIVVIFLIIIVISYPKEKKLEKGILIINTEVSGAPSMPIDLELKVSQFNKQKIGEATARISKREGYPSEKFQAKDTTIEFQI